MHSILQSHNSLRRLPIRRRTNSTARSREDRGAEGDIDGEHGSADDTYSEGYSEEDDDNDGGAEARGRETNASLSSLVRSLHEESGGDYLSDDLVRSDRPDRKRSKKATKKRQSLRRNQSSTRSVTVIPEEMMLPPSDKVEDNGLPVVQERPSFADNRQEQRRSSASSARLETPAASRQASVRSNVSNTYRPSPPSASASSSNHPRRSLHDRRPESENDEPITTAPPPTHADTGRSWFQTSSHAKHYPHHKHPHLDRQKLQQSLPTTIQDIAHHTFGTTVRQPEDEHLPKLQQDLNQPFIPSSSSHHHPSPLGRLWMKITSFDASATSGHLPGGNAASKSPLAATSGTDNGAMHSIAALIATTGNLVGISSPTVATIGPAWSYEDGAETVPGTGGKRRVARYGRREAVADEAMRANVQDDQNQVDERRRRRTERERRRQAHHAQEEGKKNPVVPLKKIDPQSSRRRSQERTSETKDEKNSGGPTTSRAQDPEKKSQAGDSNDNKKLDDLADKGTHNLLHTEGAGVQAYPAEYNIGDEDTVVPSGDISSVSENSNSDDNRGVTINRDERDLEKGARRRNTKKKKGNYAGWIGSKRGERLQQEIFITDNRSTETQCRDFLVRLANAMMIYGAPSHRLEGHLESTARVLEIDAHFFYLPSNLIMSFSKPDSGSDTAFLRAAGALDTEKLKQVHAVSRKVLHDVISAAEGSRQLKQITASRPLHTTWMRIFITGMCSFFACSAVFSGSLVDMFASFILGSLMGTCQLTLASSNPLFLNCFEVAMAFILSFFAKALSSTGYFCYNSITSASIVMILPGYVILTGCLEIASRLIVAGSIRLVYGCVLSLFLGVGISLGSKLWNVFLPSPTDGDSSISIDGSFFSSNTSISSPFTNGTFTFTNSTSSASSGTVTCSRADDAPWYLQSIHPYYLFILLPCFAFSLELWTKAKIRTRETLVSFVLACASFAAYYFAKQGISSLPEASSAIGGAIVGLGGILWSRLARGTAYTTQSVAILLLVPNGLAAAGGLAMSSVSDGTTSFELGTQVALRQIETSIGATMGLFLASLVSYAGSRRKRGNFFTY
ncbi:Domain of unknown function DUF3815 [Phaffia rhodozyma]|uniref:Threonine/serine exporter-like N-terminal domain-containing protein n=1 Tax=Phaffia rhodozyma TaxID=264483 RepID=A0A0F7STV9_PHARH|nr:Domain of unknown function DUF3815 [Phaffia rhodozyma]